MLSLSEMLRKYSIRHHNKMKVLTRPLVDHFGIHYFHFHQVKNDGGAFYISNKIELNEFVNSQADIVEYNPYTVTPAIVKDGIFDFELQKHPRFSEVSVVMKEKLHLERMISLVRKNDDGYIFCSFGFSSANPFLTRSC